jgi:hypothetical protein
MIALMQKENALHEQPNTIRIHDIEVKRQSGKPDATTR